MQSFIDENELQTPLLTIGPIGHIWPKPGLEDKAYARLNKAHPRIRVMRPAEIRARLECCDPKTVPPITLETDPGCAMIYKGVGKDLVATMDMTISSARCMPFSSLPVPVFAAALLKPFANVDVHPLIAHLTGVQPALSDGSITLLCPILISPPKECGR